MNASVQGQKKVKKNYFKKENNNRSQVRIYQVGDRLIAVYGTTRKILDGSLWFKFYDDTGYTGIVDQDTVATWNLRSELIDFPMRNKAESEIPYVFSLLWGINTLAELRSAFVSHEDKTLIMETASGYGIKRLGIRRDFVKPLIKR
jgi:hypothetical protein